ncbi:MAG: polysaccharide deacetylase family protein [Alphaproteobacteria bacterium]
MSSWDDLDRELDAWGEAGRVASLWWRDDDARRPGPRLNRLIEVGDGLPLALAAVPAEAEASLADLPANVSFLPHGWRHVNLAPASEKKCEFGPHRPAFDRLADVALGWTRLRHLFGERARPIFVPPWNRIDPAFVARLGHAGLTGLSRFGPRKAMHPAPGLTEMNCHVDIIDWRGTRGFVGDDAALAQFIAHLGARRIGGARQDAATSVDGSVDAAEATGLMTHHAVHDAECWEFLGKLCRNTAKHDAARWLSADEAASLPP